MAVKAIPEGYHSVTPYLVVDDAAALIDFITRTFDAQEMLRMPTPDGKIGHAELKIGDSIVMLADASTSETGTAMPATVMVYVEDCEKTFARAVEAGGTVLREPTDQFYGDRSAGVRDAVGNQWWIHTHIEDVPPEEMERRAEEWAKQQG